MFGEKRKKPLFLFSAELSVSGNNKDAFTE
jgi:hypothetical protein